MALAAIRESPDFQVYRDIPVAVLAAIRVFPEIRVLVDSPDSAEFQVLADSQESPDIVDREYQGIAVFQELQVTAEAASPDLAESPVLADFQAIAEIRELADFQATADQEFPVIAGLADSRDIQEAALVVTQDIPV